MTWLIQGAALTFSVGWSVWLLWRLFVRLPAESAAHWQQIWRALATAVESRSGDAQAAEKRAVLSERVAGRLGLDAEARRRLVAAAYVMDIGLCGVPLRSDRPPRETLKRFRRQSAGILRSVPVGGSVAACIEAAARPEAGVSGQGGARPTESSVLRIVGEFVDLCGRIGWRASLNALDSEQKGRDYSQVVSALRSVLTSGGEFVVRRRFTEP